jgi:hypothetical protein
MFHDIHRNDADLPSPFLWGKFSLLIGKKFWVYLVPFLGVVNFFSFVSGVLFWMILFSVIGVFLLIINCYCDFFGKLWTLFHMEFFFGCRKVKC